MICSLCELSSVSVFTIVLEIIVFKKISRIISLPGISVSVKHGLLCDSYPAMDILCSNLFLI